MKNNYWLILFLLLSLLLLCGCTAESHDLSQNFTEAPKGFWWGLWHGVISCGTFIVSLFYENIAIYEVNNNGFWYDLGFLLGIGAFGSSASRASRRS